MAPSYFSLFASALLASTANALPTKYIENRQAAPPGYVAPAAADAPAAAPTPSGPIRGVNIGGWLILESWMTPDVFEGSNSVDQWTFDSQPGAMDKLQAHWSTYFTEADVQKIASWGMNAIRIPIGYWAYNNAATPYLQGADDYLEKAIGWARANNIKVLVDCHGSPGSQNGFDNSGRSGGVTWQTGDNLDLSINALEQMAAKYGSADYADVIMGIELVNEPVSWGGNDFSTTQAWAQRAYGAVKAKATNPNLNIFMHDAFMGPASWEDIGSAINNNVAKDAAQFNVDVHLYQNQDPNDSEMNQAQHIAEACKWTSNQLLPASSNLPVFVGEFSAVTNICANPDGTTEAGSSCSADGCQCSSNVPIEQWGQPLKDATRMFLEAQMDAFEHSSQGWFIWTYNGPGAWGMSNAVQYGLVGATVTERKFPNQCGF